MFVKRKADQQRVIPRAVERNVAQKKRLEIFEKYSNEVCARQDRDAVDVDVVTATSYLLKLKARLQETVFALRFHRHTLRQRRRNTLAGMWGNIT